MLARIDQRKLKVPSQLQSKKGLEEERAKKTMNDGWEDDEELLDDNLEEKMLANPFVSHQQEQRLLQSLSLPDNAWEEDEDLLNLVDDEDESQQYGTSDWNDEMTTAEHADDKQFHVPLDTKTVLPTLDQSRALESLAKELHAYIASLPDLANAVNAIFERDCNTLEKAHELMDYYAERHQLIQYTIETELPRMEYRLTDTDGTTWFSTSSNPNQQPEIAARLARASTQDPLHSLLIRSANQSLLADALQVLTTSSSDIDLKTNHAMVRQDLFATCVAEHVTISLRLPAPSLVQVQA
jgi:hypothetical protein